LPPFVVFSLPRSRTAWLSKFLTYGDWYCGHEEGRHARTIEDISSWLSLQNTGTVETAASPWWRTLRRLKPETNVVVIRRPVEQVLDSLTRLGIAFDRAAMAKGLEHHDAKLRQIAARWPGALSLTYADLEQEDACKAVFEKCLPYPHDNAWWEYVSAVNIQCSMPHLIRYAGAFRQQMDHLGSILRHQTLSEIVFKRPISNDGVTLQIEPFADFLRDSLPLIGDHLVAVGEPPENVWSKNIPLMQTVSDMGNMQIVTAKSNGRVFGYLMTIISPSFERVGIQTAVQTTFYASPDMPGLGMKMQRYSLERFREEGRIDDVLFRAGVRGSGPNIASVYKRLGAVPYGDLYHLSLRNT